MQRWKILQPRIERFVVYRIRIQLLIDPLGEAHLLDALEIAGPRTVRQTVQRVKNRLIHAEVGDRQTLQNGILLGFLVARSRGRVRGVQAWRQKECGGQQQSCSRTKVCDAKVPSHSRVLAESSDGDLLVVIPGSR